jgi:hypothetical protein
MITTHEPNEAAVIPSAHQRVETAVKGLLESLRCSQDPEIRRSADEWMERMTRYQEQNENE